MTNEATPEEDEPLADAVVYLRHTESGMEIAVLEQSEAANPAVQFANWFGNNAQELFAKSKSAAEDGAALKLVEPAVQILGADGRRLQ